MSVNQDEWEMLLEKIEKVLDNTDEDTWAGHFKRLEIMIDRSSRALVESWFNNPPSEERLQLYREIIAETEERTRPIRDFWETVERIRIARGLPPEHRDAIIQELLLAGDMCDPKSRS
jgi:hypothetical protein